MRDMEQIEQEKSVIDLEMMKVNLDTLKSDQIRNAAFSENDLYVQKQEVTRRNIECLLSCLRQKQTLENASLDMIHNKLTGFLTKLV